LTANYGQDSSRDPSFVPAERSSPKKKVQKWPELLQKLARSFWVLEALVQQECAPPMPDSHLRSGRQQVAQVQAATTRHRFRKTGSSPDCRCHSGCSAQALPPYSLRYLGN
jgi:hypothetical protein